MMKPTRNFPVNCSIWFDFSLRNNFFQQLQFWLETIEQCRKIFQINPSDWQQIGSTFTPANCLVKDTPGSEVNTYSFCQSFKFVFDTLRQCIKLIYTSSIV